MQPRTTAASTLIADEVTELSKSLWAATANEAPLTPAMDQDAACQVAVVGAGYTGLSAALHLAQRGSSVTVLEAKSPGWGASGRNGGQVIAGLKEDPDEICARFGAEIGQRMIALSGGAPDLVFELVRRYEIDCDARQDGWLQIAHEPPMLNALERRVARWQPYTPAMERLDRGQVADLLGTDRYYGGLLDRRSGTVHPLNYAMGLARAALQEGATVHGDSPVVGIAREGAAWILETPKARLRAETVILATNGYSGPLDHELRRSIIPVCSVQVASAPLSENLRRTILPQGQAASDTRRLLYYFRLDAAGRFVIGGRGAYHRAGIAAQHARLRAAAAWLFPQVGDFDWQFHWGGNVALTLDHYPHLHELGPNLFAGLGFNGRGVAMATAMGRVLADKAGGVPDHELELPVTRLKPVPFHGLRRAVVGAMSAYYAVRDRVG
jgi:glycine/D-amino acid oxidase-like deaminating enzyme